MAGAFQSNAFQNDAFQVEIVVVPDGNGGEYIVIYRRRRGR